MRVIDRFNPPFDNLNENGSYISSCDCCGKYRIVDRVADLIERVQEGDDWVCYYRCLCGEEFGVCE
jgi:hypothetical protein